MIPSYNKKANIFLFSGLVSFLIFWLFSWLLIKLNGSIGNVVEILTALFLFGVGEILFTIGCCFKAKSIGYPAIFGLLGVTWFGIFILLALPDRGEDVK